MRKRTAKAVEALSEAEQEELRILLEEQETFKKENKILSFYPEKGPLSRKMYPKHMVFFQVGGKHKPTQYCPEDCDGSPHLERCIMAANRIGKTEGIGAYEMALHLTGEYPSWWKGHRFNHPIDAWAAGDTGQTTRDIIQLKLLGPIGSYGTGMIPKRCLIHTSTKGGLAGAVETIYVKHVSGGRSSLGLKSYDQGRLAFQGTSKHVVWLDEEPKREVYTECLLRTMKTSTFSGGIILLTFTPLLGMSEVVRDFLGITDTADIAPQTWQPSLEEDLPEELQ